MMVNESNLINKEYIDLTNNGIIIYVKVKSK